MRKKITDKSKLRDILQNTWPALSKSIKVMTDMERLTNDHRLEKTNIMNVTQGNTITKCRVRS